MICDFTLQTLKQLGLDPMYPAALCQLVRAKGAKQRGRDHLSIIMASLGSELVWSSHSETSLIF
jgi:hypothetical protein